MYHVYQFPYVYLLPFCYLFGIVFIEEINTFTYCLSYSFQYTRLYIFSH